MNLVIEDTYSRLSTLMPAPLGLGFRKAMDMTGHTLSPLLTTDYIIIFCDSDK